MSSLSAKPLSARINQRNRLSNLVLIVQDPDDGIICKGRCQTSYLRMEHIAFNLPY